MFDLFGKKKKQLIDRAYGEFVSGNIGMAQRYADEAISKGVKSFQLFNIKAHTSLSNENYSDAYISAINSISIEPDILKNGKGYEIRNQVIELFENSCSYVSAVEKGPIDVSYYVNIILNSGYSNFKLFNLRATYNFNRHDYKTIYSDIKKSIKLEPDRTINKFAYELREEFFHLLKDGEYEIDIFDLYYESETANLVAYCSESIISYLRNIDDIKFEQALNKQSHATGSVNYVVAVFTNIGLRYIQHRFKTSNKIDHVSSANFSKAINTEIRKFDNLYLSFLISMFFNYGALRGQFASKSNNSDGITLSNLDEHAEFQDILSTNNFMPLIQCVFGDDDIYNSYLKQLNPFGGDKPSNGYDFSYQSIFYQFVSFLDNEVIKKPLIV